MPAKKRHEKFQKVSIICVRGSLEDVYASLILTNGACLEGIQANLFFTFFGLDAITEKRMDSLHIAAIGNPALRLPGGIPFPTVIGTIPMMESLITSMMKAEMDKLSIPSVRELLEMIRDSGIGHIYACMLAMDMFRLKKSDLWDGVESVLTVGKFYELAAGGPIIST